MKTRARLGEGAVQERDQEEIVLRKPVDEGDLHDLVQALARIVVRLAKERGDEGEPAKPVNDGR